MGRVERRSDDPFARDLRGFGPIGIAAILAVLLAGNVSIGRMVALPAGAVLVLFWAWRSGTPWAEIGYVRPKSWLATIVGGAALGIALKLLLKTLIMPLLHADPVNRTYHFLAGNRAILPAAVWAMLVAGFGEETVFRGFLFERAVKLLAHGVGARVSAVLATSVLFGLAHLADQGVSGATQAFITGLVFGSIYAVTGSIFLPMCVHAAFDLTALAMIYWDVESKVAHWIF